MITALGGLFLSACKGSTPTAPPAAVLTVTGVTPSVGSTTGNNALLVTGTEFGPDTTVMIGGVVATNVTVVKSTSVSATVGARATPGPADVVVSSGGKTVTMVNGFTFIAPSGNNQPPVITGIKETGSRPNQPALFADLNETVTLAATATDAETPASDLRYEWTGAGTFSGTTSTVSWQLPSGAASVPLPVGVSVTAVETYSENNVTHTNRSAPFAIVLQLHDSQKEVLDMGQDFLTLFSQSDIPTDQVLHNFSTMCDGGRGRADEKADTDKNRKYYQENFAAFRITPLPPAKINFGGSCFVSDGRVQPNTDACAAYTVHWEVTYIRDLDPHHAGDHETTDGTDFMSAVVENGFWRLCHSSFVGRSTNLRTGLSRAVSW